METSPSSPVLICSPQGRPGTGYSYHAEVLRGQSGCGAAALPAPVSSLGGDGPGGSMATKAKFLSFTSHTL